MPPGKQHVRMFEQGFSDSLSWSPPINHGLKISYQMGPAQLASIQWLTVIGFRAITGTRAAIPLAHQLL
jgi:hypothetical protein